MRYTQQQTEVIEARNCDVMVSAGAGSGKTAVLTERIFQRLMDPEHPVDVDRMLVLTFTRAAAAQMKQRLLQKIQVYLQEHPSDERMQRQENLLHNAQITTIDSFCLFILRNHFHRIDIDPGFRIADSGEESLLEQEVLERVLEEAYQTGDEDFLYLVACLNPDVKEKELSESIFRLYRMACAHPAPKRWLGQMADGTDGDWTLALKELFAYTDGELQGTLSVIRVLLEAGQNGAIPEGYRRALTADLEMLEGIAADIRTDREPDEIYEDVSSAFASLTWEKLAPATKAEKESVDDFVVEQVKELRKQYKKTAEELAGLYAPAGDDARYREEAAGRLVRALAAVTLHFSEALFERKKEKNVLSFADIEHLALEILYDGDGPTETALAYRDYFEEIMVDEYQDSNDVQEMLLTVLARDESGNRNRFMVGDKKQSIYRFRLARPEIFTAKFDAYREESPDHRLVLLSDNFRSRSQVIDSVNRIFSRIMRKEIGGIDYDENEVLRCGAVYPEADDDRSGDAVMDHDTELMLCETDQTGTEKKSLEAFMIAARIHEMAGHFRVADETSEGKMRPLQYRDIAILLRKKDAEEIRKALATYGIPSHMISRAGYYSEPEVMTVMELLRCIENPYHDLPFAAAMRSVFFGISDDELALIRGHKKDISLYESFRLTAEDEERTPALRERARKALDTLNELRDLSTYLSMTKLLTEIFKRFHYREYLLALPGGGQRAANTDMLLQRAADFEKTGYGGIFRFIRYMDQLEKYSIDEGEASSLSENADVVRIMTIHASKGLEFPVVFVAGCHGEFNLTDLKKNILIDPGEGAASDGIDPVARTRRGSLKKILLKDKIKKDMLGEELRLLYVAATRAREKLIFSGVVKDGEKQPESFAYLRLFALSATDKVPADALYAGAKNYLSMLLMAYEMDHKCFGIRVYRESEIDTDRFVRASEQNKEAQIVTGLTDWEGLAKRLSEEVSATGDLYRQLDARFSYVYPHENLKYLYAKTSVSELKMAAMEEAGVHRSFETEDRTAAILPRFAGRDEKGSATGRGTAYHRVLELLDYAKYESILRKEGGREKAKNEMIRDMDGFVTEGRMQKADMELVSGDKILDFICSDPAGRMGRADARRELYKEQPFVIAIAANRLHSEIPEEERVMIQGVIDVYWEEEGELVLLDYKTDRISSPEELTGRYRTQMDYYQEALEQITGKKVKEKILYSFALMQEIRL